MTKEVRRAMTLLEAMAENARLEEELRILMMENARLKAELAVAGSGAPCDEDDDSGSARFERAGARRSGQRGALCGDLSGGC